MTYGHLSLRHPAKKVEKLDQEIFDLIFDMNETMCSAQGIGIAAPQIGVDLQIFIVDLSLKDEIKYKNQKVVLINPEIINRSDKIISQEEGCLSFPGVSGSVPRPYKIKIKGLLPSGIYRTIEATDLFSRALQHEYDHLHGKLFIDHFNDIDLKKNDLLIQSFLEKNEKILEKVYK